MKLGNLRSLNDLAKQARADHIIHTGDFGFYDETSLERIAEKSATPPSLSAFFCVRQLTSTSM